MTDIERTIAALIDAVTKDVNKIDSVDVVKAWREYLSFWPDLERASEYFHNKLLNKAINDNNDFMVVFGQYMENFRWALKNAS